MVHTLRTRRRPALLALLICALTACIGPPWEPRVDLAPWVAPGERAVRYVRAVEHNKTEWRDAGGHRYQLVAIQDDIEEFLFKTGMSAAWPPSNSHNDLGRERIAPFRFTIVTIHPTIVLMTPFEFGSPDGRSLSQLTEPIGDRGCLGNHYMVNSIECDTAAVYAPAMLWFSPDLKVKPTPIAWNGSGAEIPLGNGEVLVLVHDDEMARTTRERRGR